MERYIAIDNVCAWPNLTMMPNGDIIATIFNQPGHGICEGDVECWASEDGGRLWQLRGTPAVHEPTTNRMNVAAGLAHDDTLVVLASGWDKRPPKGQGKHGNVGQQVLPAWTCLSTDGGRTWTRGEDIPLPGDESQRIIPFGDIVKMPQGKLGACIYSWEPPNKHNAYFYTSNDNGRSWSMCGPIRKGNTNETTPIALADGRLLAAARTLDDQHLELLESTDGGKNWNEKGPATLGMQHPGNLRQLACGRLLVSYGVRNPGAYGVAARLSSDAGATWSPPRQLVTLPDNLSRNKLYPDGAGEQTPYSEGQDCGYPSSVQLDDGIIVTAYYTRGSQEHERYHMGVVRWRV